jgi:cellulose synthase operon protein C
MKPALRLPSLVVASCALAAGLCGPLHAQSSAEKMLLAKAQSLVAHGHLELAVQTWQQVVLSDPSNREALLGLAKAEMQLGKTEEAEKYAQRLRDLGNSSADLARIESMPHVQPQAVRLNDARRLTQQGRYAEAMKIYRELFPQGPPAGDMALEFYETEAALPESRRQAIEELQKMATQFSADSRYAIAVGRILTYDSKTRGQGMALLRRFDNSPEAQKALEQASSWEGDAKRSDAASTASAATANVPRVAPANPYTAKELAAPAPASEPAVDPLEGAAYRSLNSGRLDEAEQQFQTLLERNAHDAQALSGMGYVCMKRGNFADAEDYLEKARAAGAKKLEGPISTARFWNRMAQAGSEQKSGDAQSAARDYRDALAIKPSNADAEQALAGALMQAGSGGDAVAILRREVAANPQNEAAWRDLFLAQAQTGNWHETLAITQKMPRNVEARLEEDPAFLRVLIESYLATGRKADADRATDRALALPFPNHGRDLPLDKQLQYAELLITVRRYEPALRLYRQVLDVDPENPGAWRALIAAEHQLDRDDDAIAAMRSMPRSAYDESQNDSGFLALLGSIYQSRHELSSAERYLEKAIAMARTPQLRIELQLAEVYVAQGELQKAYTIYRSQIEHDSNNPDAWRGLVNTLHQSNRDQDALRQIDVMPESVRLTLERDPSYLQTLASVQDSTGRSRAALQTFELISQVYLDQQADEPADVQIQYGWLLLKAGDDRRLYSVMSKLAQMPDLTAEQQANMKSLWASWSIHRANRALTGGDLKGAIVLLETAAQAFSGNLEIYNALAGAYLKAGEPKRAVAIYASLDLRRASLDQYHGAIGAALAAHDLKHAETWLQAALDAYKDDPAILKMAAQYEQARGDAGRAAAYYRAALNAMGPQTGADVLSGSAKPVDDTGDSASGSAPMRDLLRLLAPSGPPDQRSNDPDRGNFKREADVTWRDSLRAKVTTLGDFDANAGNDREDTSISLRRDDDGPARVDAPSPKYTHVAAGTPSLGDLSAADEWQAPPPAQPAPVMRASFKLPAGRPYVQVEGTESGERPSPRRKRSQASDQVSADIQSDSAAAEKLQDAVRSMAAPRESQEPLPSLNGHDLPDRDQSSAVLSGESGSNQAVSSALPPLTGAMALSQAPLTPREQIQQQLAEIEGASSGWMGGTSTLDYRSGQPGYDRLAIYSGQVEASGMLGPGARTTVIIKPVLLDAGQATGTETIQQGTLPLGSTPYVQSAAGFAGEFQLQTANFGARIGTTPRGFLIQNYTGGLSIHPASAHFTLDFSRDPILDTQLSFAGLRDEGSVTATSPGNTWGGVIANSGEIQIHSGDALSGWYLQGGGQYLTGLHVANNQRIDGDGGTYWTAWRSPEYGNLVAGMNFFGMHYERNLRYFTYGQGGYFSPGAYMLAGVPLTFNGHYGPRFHYRVAASLGMQAFQENSAPYFPLDPVYQAAQGNPTYPERTSVGGNYDLETEGSYTIADHWYVGAYTSFNNSRDYASDRVGFFVRFLARSQPVNAESGPTGLFPIQGMRPLQTP